MPAIRFLLFILFFPLLLIFWIYWQFWGKNQSKKAQQNKELRKKWSQHLRNFDPSRLKNKSWQKNWKKHKKKPKKVKENS